MALQDNLRYFYQSEHHTDLWHLWQLPPSLPKLILWSKAQLQSPPSPTVSWGRTHCFQNSTRLPVFDIRAFANYGRITDNFDFLIYTLLFPKTQKINSVFITRKCNNSFSLKKTTTTSNPLLSNVCLGETTFLQQKSNVPWIDSFQLNKTQNFTSN